jgi:hypothetical protein
MPAILRLSVLLLSGGSLLSLAPGRVAAAQQVPVSVGQRVRVEWSEAQRRHRTAGTVLALQADSLALTEPAGLRTLSLARLERIDLRVPRSRPRGAAPGAGRGVGAGGGGGLAVAGASYAECPRHDDDMCGLAFVFLPPMGAAAGLVLGTIIGAASPGQRWHRIR